MSPAETTAAAPAPPVIDRTRRLTRGRSLRPTEFTLLLAVIMSATALSIDVMLPAFPEIRDALDLPADSTRVSGLLTAFFLGMAIAQIPAGLLADRYGRKAVLHGGLVIYVLGAIGTVLAPSLGWMLVARFVWGLGAGGPRVVSMAVVRDRYSGDQMARVMSLVMATFLVIPVLAPSIGAGLLAVGPWRLVFLFCAGVGIALNLWSLRLPETLAPEHVRPLQLGPVLAGARAVFRSRETVLLGVALSAMMGSFMSYLATAELIMEEVFDLADLFPVIFGAVAIGMGVATFANGRVVERVGTWRMLQVVLGAYVVVTTVGLVVAFSSGGRPSAGLYLPVLALMVATHALASPNLNAAAMEPVGAVAGTASALLGAVSTAAGAILGAVIDGAFDGTVRPLAVAFFVSSLVAFGCLTLARRARPAVRRV